MQTPIMTTTYKQTNNQYEADTGIQSHLPAPHLSITDDGRSYPLYILPDMISFIITCTGLGLPTPKKLESRFARFTGMEVCTYNQNSICGARSTVRVYKGQYSGIYDLLVSTFSSEMQLVEALAWGRQCTC